MTTPWTSALERLSTKISPQNFDLWLRPVQCLGIDGDIVSLRFPNPYVRFWFENNYQAAVLESLGQELPGPLRVEASVAEEDLESSSDVAFGVDPSHTESLTGRATGPDVPLDPTPSGRFVQPGYGPTPSGRFVQPGYDPTPSGRFAQPGFAQSGTTLRPRSGSAHSAGHAAQSTATAHLEQTARQLGLNPRHNFATFVAGPSNQFAATAAQKMAEVDPPPFNPLFLCGGAGLGKTHLLHAIGYRKLQMRPDARVLYLSSERFMNEFIHSIKNDKMPLFRQKYREECDVLLLDDIQFIANKDSTQEEFFHTFNALHERGRQIVLSADRKPIEIPNFADRLRTRFSMGLTVDILPPDFEVRVAILRKKAVDQHIPLSDEVSFYIAEAIKSNVRELEGALNRLMAYSQLHQRPIDLQFTKETLEGIIARPGTPMTVDQIMKTVAQYYGVKVVDLKGPKRHKAIIGPRAVAMYLARKHTGESYPDLGRSFGDKHHTSVLSACQKIAERLQKELGLRNEIEAIEAQLQR